MTAPVFLFLYALVMAVVVPRLLRGARWTQRSPRAGILAWQALSLSTVMSVVLAGGALALPSLPVSTDLAEMLHACALAIQQQYSTPAGASISIAGAVLAMAIVARASYCVAVELLTARRGRKRQHESLALVARRDQPTGALVVDHASRAVYCLPGRRREVVLTSGALAVLDEQQLHAVLAHEQAHLRRRHDMVLVLAGALRRAFPGTPVFCLAVDELARLVEMDADDAAAHQQSRQRLATALVRLAGSAAPAGTLGVGGDSALARVRRLLAPAVPLSVGSLVLVGTAAAVVLVLPVALVTAPALAAAAMDYCPLQFPT